MMQHQVPVEEETYTIFRYLSGMGWWAILAVALIAVFIYYKFKKK
jgi:uncharacterized membrane protein YukC